MERVSELRSVALENFGPLAALKNYQEPQRDLVCVGYVIQYLPH